MVDPQRQSYKNLRTMEEDRQISRQVRHLPPAVPRTLQHPTLKPRQQCPNPLPNQHHPSATPPRTPSSPRQPPFSPQAETYATTSPPHSPLQQRHSTPSIFTNFFTTFPLNRQAGRLYRSTVLEPGARQPAADILRSYLDLHPANTSSSTATHYTPTQPTNQTPH